MSYDCPKHGWMGHDRECPFCSELDAAVAKARRETSEWWHCEYFLSQRMHKCDIDQDPLCRRLDEDRLAAGYCTKCSGTGRVEAPNAQFTTRCLKCNRAAESRGEGQS